MFDGLLDQIRTHTTGWLESRRREVIDEQRRLHTEELAIVRVLDERGRIDVSMGSEGESARVVRDKVETARALESLPEIATAAYEGRLSDEQLSQATRRRVHRCGVGSARAKHPAYGPGASGAERLEAVNGRFAGALRRSVSEDVVDARQGDAEPARAAARPDGCRVRSDHREADG